MYVCVVTEEKKGYPFEVRVFVHRSDMYEQQVCCECGGGKNTKSFFVKVSFLHYSGSDMCKQVRECGNRTNKASNCLLSWCQS